MYPIKLKPAFKDYLWGGTRLRDDFGKDCDFDKIAESWELSCHKDGNSVVADGEFAGLTLAQYIEKEGKSVLGTNCEKFENFPILIKLIDAKDNLSVQVHPNNEYAQRVEGEYGKTEMWYVVDCDEGASLLYGFKHNITKEEFRERIENNTLLEVTNSVPVKKGDVFFIEAGTLHAIGGRVGADGKPRQLHIDKAVDVTNLCPAKPYPQSEPVDMGGWTKKRLAKCEYFTVDVINVDTSAALEADKSSFVNILVLDGGCVLSSEGNDAVELKKGDSVFIPAGLGKFELTGKCSAVMTHID